MPEGHTLFRLAADLQSAFGDRQVSATSPQGRFSESAALIDGRLVESAESAGKHLFLRFDNEQILHVHLGLIGGFRIASAPVSPPVGQVRLRLVGPSSYADLRGATTCELISAAELEEILARLGPDPLRSDADPERGFARLHKSGKSVGALLMDQRVLAGVGNIFRAESLFRARLHPLTPGNRISRRRWNALWTDLVALMAYGVETGRIDTVRSEHEPEVMGREPRVDKHGGEVYVYRRAGLACHVCGTRVKTQVLEGRNLYWCSTCQRRR
ncbi:MAG: Fpg/Nei family DNA glycosylase [Nocardioidaceae bacterium]|nr:Fpg/Nei family DNA glycosylase [Nocardioidaceae bacterium]